MSKKSTTIRAQKLNDGSLVEVLTDGATRPFPPDQTDWAALDAMTDQEIYAAALADPDAQPLTDEQLAQMKPFSRAKRYGIPLTTLGDWEQYRTEPDQAAQSYILAIEACPDEIAKALSKRWEPQPA